jgi:hypothetical protein
MRRADVALFCVVIFFASACDYKGPTAVKQSVVDLIDASSPVDAAPQVSQTPVKRSSACDRLDAANKHIEAQATALEPTCPKRPSVVDALRTCRSTPSGVVGIKLAAMHLRAASASASPCEIEARVELVHIDAKNVEAATLIGIAPSHDASGSNYNDVNGWKWDALGAPTFFDFDGDGEPEIVVAGVPPDVGADEWQGYEWHEAWTFRGGSWKKYAPLANAHFSKVEDVDHDGRPDVRTRGGYDAFAVISGMPTPESIIEPVFVLHSLPNGTFSANDSIAKKAANDACANARHFPFSGPGHDLDGRDALTIACARIHGQSAVDVVKKLSATCKAYFDDISDAAADHCPAWAKQIATATPPLTLP